VFGGGAVVEAEGAGDDRRRGLEHELAERCCPCLGERDAEFVELSAEPDGHKGLADAPAGNSHWQPGLAAVFIFTRLAASSVSIAANGSGTGVGGSPSRMKTWPSSPVMMSSRVRRASRLTGWA
jgi:hypothetical protein